MGRTGRESESRNPGQAEGRARQEIDRQLVACGWLVQDRAETNLYAAQGVAVREFVMAPGHGRADYLLFVDGKAVGAIEAKPSGTPLAGVEPQSAKYAAGLPPELTTLVTTFHRPETFARWLRKWVDDADGGSRAAQGGGSRVLTSEFMTTIATFCGIDASADACTPPTVVESDDPSMSHPPA